MMAYTVYTYGGGEAVYETLNAVAAMTGGADYMGLVKVFMVLGLLWVVIETSLHQSINWQWIVMFMLMFNIFFVPKETVVVVDRFNPGNTRVVANVPFGLAAPAWLFSLMGDGLTRLTETVFTQPNDLQYGTTGMVFGSKLLTTVNHARFNDPLLNKNLTMYAKQCIFMNIAYGFYTVRDVYTSNNLLDLLLNTTYNSGLRGMFYTMGPGNSLFLTCQQAAVQLRTDITPVVNKMVPELANKIFGYMGQSAALNKAHLLVALPAAYGYLSNISTTAQQMVTQAAMSNFIENAYGDVAAMMGNAAAAQAWSTAVAERQQRSSYRTMGQLAQKSLPIMQTVFRVLIYALFFIVFLAFMLPITVSGPSVLTYFKLFIWIETWPSLFAVLNMVVNLYAKAATTLSIDPSLGVTSMAGMAGMNDVNSDLSIIAGYLALSIPLLAWGLVTKGGNAANLLAQSIFAPATQAANQVGGEVSRGNISTGNLSAGNESIMQGQSAPHMQTGASLDNGAFRTDISPDGQVRSHINQSDLGVGIVATEQMQSTASRNLTQARSVNQTASVNESQAQMNQNAATSSLIDTARTGAGNNATFTVAEQTFDTEKVQTTQDVAHNFNTGQQLADSTKAQILANASASMSGGFELFGNGGKISGSARIDGISDSALQKIYKSDDTFKAAAAYSDAQQVQNSVADNVSQTGSTQHDTTAGKAVTSAHTELTQAQQTHSAAKSKVDTYETQDAFIKSHGNTITANASIEYEKYLAAKGVDFHDRGNLGRMEKIAGSADFQEAVLHDTGMDMDLNGDGRISTMQDVIKNKEDHFADGMSSKPAELSNKAIAAQRAAGLDPNHLPEMKEVTDRIQSGKATSQDIVQAVTSGKMKLSAEGGQIKAEVNGQSTHVSARALENAGKNLVGFLPESVTGLIGKITVNQTDLNGQHKVGELTPPTMGNNDTISNITPGKPWDEAKK